MTTIAKFRNLLLWFFIVAVLLILFFPVKYYHADGFDRDKHITADSFVSSAGIVIFRKQRTFSVDSRSHVITPQK